jgi:hypothetical protein
MSSGVVHAKRWRKPGESQLPQVMVRACEPMTLQEVADRLGLTRERVRQIEFKALDKAAQYLAERGLRVQDVFPDGRAELGAAVRKSRLSE